MGIKNDISFIIDDIINLYEHQSSYNPNMPIRGLFYLADVYRKFVDSQDINLYGSVLIRLPYPKYVVFYNGSAEKPDRIELKLSNAFTHGDEGEPTLEFIATMLNINVGHNKELLKQCKRLRDYALFVDEVRKLLTKDMPLKKAIDTAIDNCINRDILADILSAHRSEVRDMCLYDYNFEKHMELERKQWKDIGVQEESERNIKALIYTFQAKNFSYTDTIQALTSQFQISDQQAEDFMKSHWSL